MEPKLHFQELHAFTSLLWLLPLVSECGVDLWVVFTSIIHLLLSFSLSITSSYIGFTVKYCGLLRLMTGYKNVLFAYTVIMPDEWPANRVRA